MLNTILQLILRATSPCEIDVNEPTTFYTDGFDVLDAEGADVLGCTVFTDDPSDITIEASADAIITGSRWWESLTAGESTTLPDFGEFSVGTPPLEGNQSNGTTFCCKTVCAPFVGCVTVCYQGCGGVDKIIDVKMPPPDPKH